MDCNGQSHFVSEVHVASAVTATRTRRRPPTFYDRNDHSKMVKQLLSDEVPAVAKAKPHRPVSANPVPPAAKPAKHKINKGANAALREEISKTSREDLILELQELKRKHRALEEAHNQVRAENQRLEADSAKQQRRIDQLLNLSEGAKNIGISSEIRRDIEKSILVRQLKNQINNLRNDLAEKESEVDNLKRNAKSTYVAELTFERDEYLLEVQRLRAALTEVKEELHRERQRREWNTRVAGDASEDLRKEVARLSSGYQNMLANISSRASSANGQRPSTTTGTRPGPASAELTPAASARPVSATATSGAHSPTKEGERPKRPLSATPKNTPLSAYYQAKEIPGSVVANPQLLPASADPLDNFGLPGHALPAATLQAAAPAAVPALGLTGDILADMAPAATTGNKASDVGDSGIFKVGDRVQGQYQGGASWYNGVVRAYHPSDGTYEINYDDGDHEDHVPLSRVRAIAAAVDVIPVRTTPVMVPTLAAAPASHPALIAGSNPNFAPSPAAKPKPTASTSSAPFKIGDKIEALYYRGTTWYSGKIQAVHVAPTPADGEFVFDIAYDDGDRELKVPVSNIRAKAAAPAAAPTKQQPAAEAATPSPKTADPAPQPSPAKPAPNKTEAAAVAPAKFKVGEPVEGYYAGGPEWYKGKIRKINANGGAVTYDIDYDDGDRETNVSESNIRAIVAASSSPRTASNGAATNAVAAKFKAGERIQGYFEDMAAWYDGTVAAVNSDGTYFIRFDDGDEDKTFPQSKMRPLVATASPAKAAPVAAPAVQPAPAAAPAPAPVPVVEKVPESMFKVNDRVEGKYGNGDAWYPAVITKVTNPGLAALYSLEYDDGDREDLVDDSCIRLMALPPQQAASVLPVASSAPKAAPPRKPSIVNTNLDSFLNDLSDDDDSTGGGLGNLDSGRGMTLGAKTDEGPPDMMRRSKAETDDGYDEDFDA